MRQKSCKLWMRDPTWQWGKNTFFPNQECIHKWKWILLKLQGKEWGNYCWEVEYNYRWGVHLKQQVLGSFERRVARDNATCKEGACYLTHLNILTHWFTYWCYTIFPPDLKKWALGKCTFQTLKSCALEGKHSWPHEAVKMGSEKLSPVLTTLVQLNLS